MLAIAAALPDSPSYSWFAVCSVSLRHCRTFRYFCVEVCQASIPTKQCLCSGRGFAGPFDVTHTPKKRRRNNDTATITCNMHACIYAYSCHVRARSVMSCQLMSCHVIAGHAMKDHVSSCHVMSWQAMSCNVMWCTYACMRFAALPELPR